MSASDSRQSSRFANTNANTIRRTNWGSSSDTRDYRPVGQRYGSVLVLSGPKRKQAGPAVRKPIPRPVNLPSQRKDRYAEGSLLGGKQGRPDDASQQAENTTHSLNTPSWQNASGTWNPPQEATNRTDEYGFPIRSEAPINSREFPTLAASKQSAPNKQRSQQDEADAYFSLDDRDALPAPKPSNERSFGSQREDQRPDNRQDWRTSRTSTSRDGDRPFRDDVENRLFSNNRPNPESRRGAFGFHMQDSERSRSGMGVARSGSRGGRVSDNGGSTSGGGFSQGAAALGRTSQGGERYSSSSARLEDYGLRPGGAPSGGESRPGPAGPKPPDDYIGPASQIHGTNSVFSSTLLAAGVAPPSAVLSTGTPKEDDVDSEEDEELQAHYKELELIKAEEEEKDRQRALAAEAQAEEGLGSGDEEGAEEVGGGSWEDAVEEGMEGSTAAAGSQPPGSSEETMGLKPVDPQRWMQRQAEIEAEDRERRERAEAKKRELEEAIARREEKARAAREASLAALAAANTPLPAVPPQVVVPPPPPPPRSAQAHSQAASAAAEEDVGSTGGTKGSMYAGQTPPDSGSRAASDVATGQPQVRRPDFVPAPAPSKPAWGQSLQGREAQKVVGLGTGEGAPTVIAAQPPPPPARDVHAAQSQESWSGEVADSRSWREENVGPYSSDGGGARSRDGLHHREDSTGGRGGGRNRRNRGEGGRGGGRTAGGGGASSARSIPMVEERSNGIGSSHAAGSTGSATGGFSSRPAASVGGSSTTASDADAAAVAAAAKVAKAMENYVLPALPTPTNRGSSSSVNSKPAEVQLQPAVNGTVVGAASAASPAMQQVPSVPVQQPPPPPPQHVQQEQQQKLPEESSSMPGPQHSAPAVYESQYNTAVELLQTANSVPAMDHDEKHNGLFDGGDMGENLLPSNILGMDDAPYTSSKPKAAEPVTHPHQPLLSMHDPSFSPNLDQNKAMSPITHAARPFTRSDHGSGALPLGTAPPFGAPPQPHNVRDRLPDNVQLWGVGREWDAPSQNPLGHPPSGDLHAHHPSFGTVPPGVIYNTPSKPQGQPGAVQVTAGPPGSAPPPVYHNTFNYGTAPMFGVPSYSARSPHHQLQVPLVPTSKPPDWSNNGSSAVGWNAMPAHPAPPQTRPVAVLPTSIAMSDGQAYQMQEAQGVPHTGTFSQNGAPMQQAGMAVGPAGAQQHRRMRMSDVEMKLPDNLGLGTSPPITHVSLAPPVQSPQQQQQQQPQQPMPPQPQPPSGLNVRSRGGHRGRGGGGPPSGSGSRGNPSADGGSGHGGRDSGGGGHHRRGHGQGHGHGGSDAERGHSQGGGGRRQSGRGGRGRGHGQGRRGRDRAEHAGALVSVE